MSLQIDPAVRDLAVGLVLARHVKIAPAGDVQIQQAQQAVQALVADGPEGGDARRQAVRGLLRCGGYKPSGADKPAQEYLLRTAAGGRWPTILNAVDVLNLVSLRSGLPISLVAVGRLQPPLLIRYGRPEESFVFNAAGQELKLEGLLTICHTVDGATQPVGTPVKDSLLAKITAEDDQVLACLFAGSAVPANRLQYWAEQLAAGLQQWCAAQSWRHPCSGVLDEPRSVLFIGDRKMGGGRNIFWHEPLGCGRPGSAGRKAASACSMQLVFLPQFSCPHKQVERL